MTFQLYIEKYWDFNSLICKKHNIKLKKSKFNNFYCNECIKIEYKK